MLSVMKSRLRAALSYRDFRFQHNPWRNLGIQRSVSTWLDPWRLELGEVEEILNDVKAGDVKVIPVQGLCQWTDFMVIATGKSAWHVRNIAQALIHKVKEKQKGNDHISIPSVEGYEGGKWIVVNSGNVTVHALDEKARLYYNLESLWTGKKVPKDPDLEIV